MIIHKLHNVVGFQIDAKLANQQKLAEFHLDSLMAMDLANQLGELFGRSFSAVMIEHYPTIASLADYLVALVTHGHAGVPSPLVALQSAGSELPFFCVPGAFGTISILRELSHHLGTQRPFYALQLVDDASNNEIELDMTIEHMADFYIEAIRQVQPQGPYLLGGWSFGGHVAFEMANQLLKQGHEIGLLVMIDSPLLSPPQNPKVQLDAAKDEVQQLVDVAKFIAFSLGKHLAIEYADIEQLEPTQREEAIINQMIALGNNPTEQSYIRTLQRRCKANLHALKHYTPQLYAQSVLFVQASAKFPDDIGLALPVETALAWQPHCAQALQIYRLPGNHFTIMKEPYVQQLAYCLQQHLALCKK